MKLTKKILAITLILTVCMSFTGCGKSGTAVQEKNSKYLTPMITEFTLEDVHKTKTPKSYTVEKYDMKEETLISSEEVEVKNGYTPLWKELKDEDFQDCTLRNGYHCIHSTCEIDGVEKEVVYICDFKDNIIKYAEIADEDVLTFYEYEY